MGQPLHQNLYEILEVAKDAPQEDIHKAFMRAKHTYSPDSPALYSVFTKEEAEDLLKMIEEAYAILGNPGKRKEYDASLSREISEPKPVEKKNEKTEKKTTASKPPHLTLVDEPPPRLNPNDVPKGRGRTPFSHYEIDPAIEKEIQEQQVYDGTFLQKIRNYKNVSLEHLSKSTRIGKHYLVAVETNDFHSLPAPVFVRGFIIQIARILGLDEKKAADSFMKLFKESTTK